MQIVIDVPEEVYNRFCRCNRFPDEVEEAIIAITDGTLLPKGHGRLIDADEAISKICGNSCGCHLEECGRDNPCFSVTRIKSVQTIIEADKEVKDAGGKM